MTEFDDVIRRLEDGRPEATAQELDAIKLRIRRRAAEPSRRSQSMKSRLAILGMLVTGILFSTAGAGLAVSGLGDANTNAAISQYATPTPTPTPCVETNGATSPSQTGGGGDVCGSTPTGGVLPAEAENAPKANKPKPKPASGFAGGVAPAEESAAGTQPVRQQAAAVETSQLPFTGFAAIPVLLGGLALLAGGLVLRRRTRQN